MLGYASKVGVSPGMACLTMVVSLCAAGCGSTIVGSLFASAIALEIIYFVLLLLECFSHICLEVVVLNLHLLGCV